MRKALVSAMAVLALGLPLVAQTTVTCSSQNGRRQFCPANTSNGVRLRREQSNNVCQQGSTWSYNQRGIRVSGGCSADFELGNSNGTNANNGNGSGYDNQNANGSGYGNNNANGNNNSNRDNNANGNNNPNRDDNANGNNNANRDNNANGNNNANRDNNANGNNNGNRDNNGNRNNNANENGYGGTNANGNTSGYGNNNGNANTSRQRGPVLPSGTQLSVRLDQAVRTAEVNQGDVVPASLVNDLSVDGNVVAPAGTPVQAKIQSAQGSPLNLRLDSMTVNGRTYTLVTNAVHGLRDSTTQNSSNPTAKQQLGDLLGNVTGSSQVPSGTVFNFRLTSPARPSGNGSPNNGPANNY